MQLNSNTFSLQERSALSSVALQRVLGSGRHGTVFLGTVEHQDAPVAIKIAAKGTSITDEAAALGKLAHPHVVQLIAAELPSTVVVEFCAEGTLTDLTTGGPLTLLKVRKIFTGVTAALGYIHLLGWMHGDISPQNIGLRPVGGAALLDFSTARMADGSALEQGPEEFAGELRQASAAFDVRCATAVALSVIDADDPNPMTAETLASLHRLIERADAGEQVCVDDLAAALDIGANSAGCATVINQTAGAPPAPPTTRTRDFGPGPGDAAEEPVEETQPGRRGPVVIAILLAFALVGAMAVEFLLPSPTPALSEQPGATFGPRVVSAETTLQWNGASWDVATGILSVHSNAATEHWDVGQPGDLAAMGDWDCDGVPTLGVLRPGDGAWFTFDTWEAGSTSTVERIAADTAPVTLQVQLDATGCAAPWIS